MNFSSGNSAYDQNVDIDFEMTALTALKWNFMYQWDACA
jgi:hypothetical protein